MADLVKIIDGTEVGSPARDYSTLAAFEAAYDGDGWASSYDNLVAQVRNVPTDSGTVYWAGWSSGMTSAHRIVVEAYPGQETNFVDDAYGGRIEDRHVIAEATNAVFMDFRNLDFHVTAAEGIYVQASSSAGQEYRITKCMVRDSSSSGIRVQTVGTTTVYVGGCLSKAITGAYNSGFYCRDVDATFYAYSCTAFGSGGIGFDNFAGTYTAKNCAAASNTDGDFGGTISETTNKSEDDAEITSNDADDFTAPSTDDFHVYDTNSNLYHTGTVISDSWFTTLCATDVDGTTWDSSNPSVGCYEFPESGGAALSGTNSISVTASGNLTGKASLSGTNSIAVTASGNLTGKASLLGTNDISVTASGNLIRKAYMSGTNAIAVTASGDLTISAASGALSGTNNMSVTASGNLTGTGSLLQQLQLDGMGGLYKNSGMSGGMQG